MRSLQIVALLGATLFLTGCFDDNELTIYNDINGQVLENGEAVSDAEIHIRNHFDPGGFRTDVLGDSVSFSFNAVFDGLYTASVFRHGSDTAFAIFFRDSLTSGRQSLEIPDSLLSNGIIGYQVSAEGQSLGSSLILVNKPDSSLIGTLPFNVTNSSGDFTLSAGQLALGRSFNFSDGSGFDVTDSLEIIIIKDGVIRKNEFIEVDPEEENYVEITLD